MMWKVVANSWQYTSIYGADGKRLFLMDLEDWGVTEENQEALEKQQADIAALAAQAPAMQSILMRLIKWDTDFPVNSHNGYAGLKELDKIIADAKAATGAGDQL